MKIRRSAENQDKLVVVLNAQTRQSTHLAGARRTNKQTFAQRQRISNTPTLNSYILPLNLKHKLSARAWLCGLDDGC